MTKKISFRTTEYSQHALNEIQELMPDKSPTDIINEAIVHLAATMKEQTKETDGRKLG